MCIVQKNAALKSECFKDIVSLLQPQVNNAGDRAWEWNSEPTEAAVYHSSVTDKNFGKKCCNS